MVLTNISDHAHPLSLIHQSPQTISSFMLFLSFKLYPLNLMKTNYLASKNYTFSWVFSSSMSSAPFSLFFFLLTFLCCGITKHNPGPAVSSGDAQSQRSDYLNASGAPAVSTMPLIITFRDLQLLISLSTLLVSLIRTQIFSPYTKRHLCPASRKKKNPGVQLSFHFHCHPLLMPP